MYYIYTNFEHWKVSQVVFSKTKIVMKMNNKNIKNIKILIKKLINKILLIILYIYIERESEKEIERF